MQVKCLIYNAYLPLITECKNKDLNVQVPKRQGIDLGGTLCTASHSHVLAYFLVLTEICMAPAVPHQHQFLGSNGSEKPHLISAMLLKFLKKCILIFLHLLIFTQPKSNYLILTEICSILNLTIIDFMYIFGRQ